MNDNINIKQEPLDIKFEPNFVTAYKEEDKCNAKCSNSEEGESTKQQLSISTISIAIKEEHAPKQEPDYVDIDYDDNINEPYECLQCRKFCAAKSKLRAHIELYCKMSRYECNICHKRYYLQSRKYHMRSHTGALPYVCDICKRDFKDQHSLTSHTRTHTGEKPYQCNICSKRFNRPSHLKVHMHTHGGQKPYACDKCPYKFIWKSQLTVHMRIHSGEKSYECDICHKTFSRNGQLSVHKRSHTGEKPYECDICHQRFSLKQSLTVHKRIHTGEKPYECDICHKTFTRNGQLSIHKRSHAGEKPLLVRYLP